MPVPVLARLPLPLIEPAKVVLRLAPPTVRVLLPSCTAPAPASAARVSFDDSDRLAPLFTVTLETSAMALPPLSASVPPATMVSPV